jgi:hypothetical protein
MYENTNEETVQMFADVTAGEENRSGSLKTVRRDNGEVELRSYGWAAIARVDSATGEVVLFDGHRDLSKTTHQHISLVEEVVDDERLVRSSETPIVARAPECVKYISSYVGGFTTPNSPVDNRAMNDVARDLNRI